MHTFLSNCLKPFYCHVHYSYRFYSDAKVKQYQCADVSTNEADNS